MPCIVSGLSLKTMDTDVGQRQKQNTQQGATHLIRLWSVPHMARDVVLTLSSLPYINQNRERPRSLGARLNPSKRRQVQAVRDLDCGGKCRLAFQCCNDNGSGSSQSTVHHGQTVANVFSEHSGSQKRRWNPGSQSSLEKNLRSPHSAGR